MRVRREDCYHSHVCRVDKTHLKTSVKCTNLFNHTLITSWFTLQVTAAVFSSCLFLLISRVFLILSFHVTLSSQQSHKKRKKKKKADENLCIPSPDTNSNTLSRDGDNYRSENRFLPPADGSPPLHLGGTAEAF